eukprot:g20403.t1
MCRELHSAKFQEKDQADVYPDLIADRILGVGVINPNDVQLLCPLHRMERMVLGPSCDPLTEGTQMEEVMVRWYYRLPVNPETQ